MEYLLDFWNNFWFIVILSIVLAFVYMRTKKLPSHLQIVVMAVFYMVIGLVAVKFKPFITVDKYSPYMYPVAVAAFLLTGVGWSLKWRHYLKVKGEQPGNIHQLKLFAGVGAIWVVTFSIIYFLYLAIHNSVA